jgi:predicted flap endonuclease-1-like 5' DNA nuclease
MDKQIRPIEAGEAAGTSWIVAALVGFFAFVLLFRMDWTFLQAAFGGGVIFVVLGILIAQTVGRIKPLSAYAGRPPTVEVRKGEEIALGVDMTALRPRDLNAPSPHRSEIAPSILSDGETRKRLGQDGQPRAIFGTVEAAEATRVPAPAPINAADPGVARPVGATANPKPLAQPAPLDGRVISPEAPEPIDPTREGTSVSRNEAATAAGATTRPAPTATPAAQSYNEPGDGSDTVEASGNTRAPDADSDPRIAPGAGADPGRGADAVDHGRPGPSSPEERTAMRPGEAPEADRARPRAPEFGTAGTGAGSEAGSGAPEGKKPPTLDAPRDGQGDDLSKMRGVGPKLKETLNEMGFYHFDQIAAWSEEEVAWVDGQLEGVKGRVSRDDWVGQAKALSEGRDPA